MKNCKNHYLWSLLKKLKLSWGEKYQQWMAQTEQKIEELQAANNFL